MFTTESVGTPPPAVVQPAKSTRIFLVALDDMYGPPHTTLVCHVRPPPSTQEPVVMEVMAWAEGAPKNVATRMRANRAIRDRLGIVEAPLPGQRALRTGAVTCGWVSVKPNMRRPPTHWPA